MDKTILKTDGKIYVKQGGRYIALINELGNLNLKLENSNIIKRINSLGELLDEGFYLLNGTLHFYVDNNLHPLFNITNSLISPNSNEPVSSSTLFEKFSEVAENLDIKSKEATTKVTVSNGLSVTKTTNEDNSSTYNISPDITLNYVLSTQLTPAKIELLSNTGTVFGTIQVSDIIGNGLLNSTSYNKNTSILSLVFNNASGTTLTVEVDLKDLLDINDISIFNNSSNYLELSVDPLEDSSNKMILKAKIINPEEATAQSTGLADAFLVREFVIKNKNIPMFRELWTNAFLNGEAFDDYDIIDDYPYEDPSDYEIGNLYFVEDNQMFMYKDGDTLYTKWKAYEYLSDDTCYNVNGIAKDNLYYGYEHDIIYCITLDATVILKLTDENAVKQLMEQYDKEHFPIVPFYNITVIREDIEEAGNFHSDSPSTTYLNDMAEYGGASIIYDVDYEKFYLRIYDYDTDTEHLYAQWPAFRDGDEGIEYLDHTRYNTRYGIVPYTFYLLMWGEMYYSQSEGTGLTVLPTKSEVNNLSSKVTTALQDITKLYGNVTIPFVHSVVTTAISSSYIKSSNAYSSYSKIIYSTDKKRFYAVVGNYYYTQWNALAGSNYYYAPYNAYMNGNNVIPKYYHFIDEGIIYISGNVSSINFDNILQSYMDHWDHIINSVFKYHEITSSTVVNGVDKINVYAMHFNYADFDELSLTGDVLVYCDGFDTLFSTDNECNDYGDSLDRPTLFTLEFITASNSSTRISVTMGGTPVTIWLNPQIGVLDPDTHYMLSVYHDTAVLVKCEERSYA